MSYVPPWRRRQLELAKDPVVPMRKPKFLGNALGDSDVLANSGIRYSPRSPGALPAKPIRRIGPTIQPNSSPILQPSHNLTKIQPKFRAKVLKAMEPTRKAVAKKLRRKGKTKKQIRTWLKKKI